jgi:hypothetical protein
MATNPMQRKARNSFLLGMLLTLLIASVIIVGLLWYMMQIKQEQKEIEESYVDVYVLNKDVKSGDEITASDLTVMQTSKNAAPSDPISLASLGDVNIAKIDMTKGTVVSANMLVIDNTTLGDDVRVQEYNMIVLPTELEAGDYVDIRLLLPSGQDYIVVSKKQVGIPYVGTSYATDTITMEMKEAEIVAMSNAIVDAFRVNGSKLYATKYSEPGNQEASTPTYVVSNEVAQLINSNPNMVGDAAKALAERYNSNTELRQNYINSAISSQDDAQANEEDGMSESITNTQTTREEYLQSLTGGTTVTE